MKRTIVPVFVDTNVLMYALDSRVATKQRVAAAIHQNCEILLSEDLQHDQIIEGVRVVDPFRIGA